MRLGRAHGHESRAPHALHRRPKIDSGRSKSDLRLCCYFTGTVSGRPFSEMVNAKALAGVVALRFFTRCTCLGARLKVSPGLKVTGGWPLTSMLIVPSRRYASSSPG